MTDGCGYINKIPLSLMQIRFDWDTFPTAIQCRLAGSKVGCKLPLSLQSVYHSHVVFSQGLLMLPHSKDDAHIDPLVRIRPSQVKIRYPSNLPLDPAMLFIDLLTLSRIRSPSRLSHEVLVNLAENGVPHSVFARLFTAGLDELVAGLMAWDDPMALWRTLSRKGGVMSERRKRAAGGESRARGYGEKEKEEVEEWEMDDDELIESMLKVGSTAWWWDEVSGCPSSLEETVMVLLDAGFVPQECAVLRARLKHIVLTSVDTYLRKARLEVPMSCTAFIVPGGFILSRQLVYQLKTWPFLSWSFADPFCVLGPGEVHIKSSRRNLKCGDGLETNLIVGDVLVCHCFFSFVFCRASLLPSTADSAPMQIANGHSKG
jgi:RNA-dependent RNA polymerase